MSEEKTNIMLNKIETLITDGNKTVLGRLDKVESRLGGVETRLDGLEQRHVKLEEGQQKIVKTLRKEIKQSYDFASYDLNQAEKRLSDKIDIVDEKLEKRLRVPHAV